MISPGSTILTTFPRKYVKVSVLLQGLDTWYRVLLRLLNIYRSLIEPYISYGFVAWCQAANVHLNKIVILQKWVFRLMYFSDYTSHSAPLFACSGILPIKMLFFKLPVASLLHDIENRCVPPNISLITLFTRSEQVHSYFTRFSVSGSLSI